MQGTKYKIGEKGDWVRILISGYKTSHRLSNSKSKSSESLSTKANVWKITVLSTPTMGGMTTE